MTLKVLHVVNTMPAGVGEIAAELPGLLESLKTLGVAGALSPAEPHSRAPADFDEFDLAHFHGLPGPSHRALVQAIHRAGLPFVVSPHSALMPNEFERRAPLARITGFLSGDRRFVHKAAAVHAALPEEAEFLRNRKCNARVELIPCGVDGNMSSSADSTLLDDFPLVRDKRCLLFLGALHPIEGLVPMLKACDDVLHGRDDWHVVLAGHEKDDWLKMIRAAVERRSVSDRVTIIVDPAPGLQLALLRQCQVVIQPSLLARSPRSVLRGLMLGTPCIVSARCGLSEIADCGCGWENEPDRSSIAGALGRALGASADELSAMGARGSAWVEQHRTWGALAARYRDFYGSIVR